MQNFRLSFIVLIFCLLFLASCKEEKVEYPIIIVEPVAVENVSIYATYPGTIRAIRNVEVHARVEGYLEKMTFSEGKQVKQGEPLFYINNRPYKAKLEKAKAQLEKNKAQELKTKNDLERIRPLVRLNAASQLDLDNAEAAYNIAKAEVAMSKADMEQAQLEFDYTIVRSPITGYISERYADVGTLVGKSNTSLLARVVKRDTVSVDFKMTALDYLRSQRRNVHIGDVDTTRWWQPTVTVTLADNSVYNEVGIVDFASPQVDIKTGTFGVRADLPNPNQVLLPGQFTRVKLLVDVLENAVVVPRKALMIEKGGASVYVVGPDSIVEKRIIEIGPEQNNLVVVGNNVLKPNERIVVEGYQKLVPRQKVIPRTVEEDELIKNEEAAKLQKEED
ncbi:MAG: efflux RND transporter periplasmic adaptor subunit [Bacteroidales bacterium]|nr:efflux RND transporter periplasmic adaptor subunit [Bacteroidales bacterium]